MVLGYPQNNNLLYKKPSKLLIIIYLYNKEE